MIVIRNAVTSDQAFVLSLKNDPEALFWSARATPVTHEEHTLWFPRALEDPDVVLLVAVDREIGDLIGYARIVTHHESRISFAVAPDRRNQGIGTALLETCEEIAQITGRNSLMAYVHPGNSASLGAFRNQGYRLGEMRGIFQTLTKTIKRCV